jgi:hypothetical protein
MSWKMGPDGYEEKDDDDGIDVLPSNGTQQPRAGNRTKGKPFGGLRKMKAIPVVPLTIKEWLARDLPPPDRILGEWLTTTSRVYVSADTGLGKTSLLMAVAVHCGAGLSFLRWRSHRPARVLFIDGEMSRRLLKKRIEEAVARLGVEPENVLFLSREDIEDFPPLNTPEGMQWLLQFVADKGVDLIIFDNIMALLVGDQKDELSWNAILLLLSELTKRNIGQLWIDHTGHDATRGYGSKTKQWRMDTTIHLTAVPRDDTDISFMLEFRKARERTPETRADFENMTIALIDDAWIEEGSKRQPGNPSTQEASVLRVFDDLLCGSDVVIHNGRRAIHNDVWKAECIRKGLVSDRTFDTHRRLLAGKDLIACDGELSWKP